MDAMRGDPNIRRVLVHTGQHYDHEMSRAFFEDLVIPEPDFFLGVGSGSHAQQTAKVMVEFEKVLDEVRPDLVVVVGDLNSTLACALTAAKLLIPVAHVEAGLRSFDRTMPEEINRTLTDHVSDYLFTPSEDADENLHREGVAPAKIYRVGNVMIDTLRKYEGLARKRAAARELGCGPREYAVLTLHRPSNVDEPEAFGRILDGLEAILPRCPVVFPVHPRTRKRLVEFGLGPRLQRLTDLKVCPPLGYLAFLSLLMDSRFVMTDSGGIQEETTALCIPCLTLRENTERPITVSVGTNRVVGTHPDHVAAEVLRILDEDGSRGGMPALWDGRAADRIVDVLRSHAVGRKARR
jgi:UDP-N-acetylglucosamine 2-epimerase (non-hydrolysing)